MGGTRNALHIFMELDKNANLNTNNKIEMMLLIKI